MGKRLIQQRRGSGSSVYRANSFSWAGEAKYPSLKKGEVLVGEIKEFIHSRGHSAPLSRVCFDNGSESLLISAIGVKLGQKLSVGNHDDVSKGQVVFLKDVTEGTEVFNIESKPGDGGKFVKSSGTFAKVVGILEDSIRVMLPSGKVKLFNPNVRATVGRVAGSGRVEKPLIKAGNNHFKKKAKNKLYPRVAGLAMNAVDHPYGCKRSSRKGIPLIAPRHAPPGRKVGLLKPKKTGRGGRKN
jgi:large subunit ribosomal protein L2